MDKYAVIYFDEEVDHYELRWFNKQENAVRSYLELSVLNEEVYLVKILKQPKR